MSPSGNTKDSAARHAGGHLGFAILAVARFAFGVAALY